MAVLSDKDIREALASGEIICEPFNEINLGSASYDVTLGENYYQWNRDLSLEVYNPYNSEHVNSFWKLNKAVRVTKEDVTVYGCKPGSKIIIVNPRETILAHTNEFIGGLKNITTKMQARSSYGRNCITVCKCAGLGDVAYVNKWCMEIENCGFLPVILTVGERIAQIAFLRTGEVEKEYSGSYQSTTDINELKANWKPEMMLPKLKYD